MAGIVEVPELLERPCHHIVFGVDDETAALVGDAAPKLRRVLSALGVVEDEKPVGGVGRPLHHRRVDLSAEVVGGEEFKQLHEARIRRIPFPNREALIRTIGVSSVLSLLFL